MPGAYHFNNKTGAYQYEEEVMAEVCDFCGQDIGVNPMDYLDATSMFCSDACYTNARDDKVVPNDIRKRKALNVSYKKQVDYRPPSSMSPRCPKCKGQQVIAILDEGTRYCTTCKSHELNPSR